MSRLSRDSLWKSSEGLGFPSSAEGRSCLWVLGRSLCEGFGPSGCSTPSSDLFSRSIAEKWQRVIHGVWEFEPVNPTLRKTVGARSPPPTNWD
jgi:hypothetical protein